MGMISGDDLVLAGLCMSRQEWNELDELSRSELLQALAESSPPGWDDHAYESYELVIAPAT